MALIERQGLVFVLPHQFEKNKQKITPQVHKKLDYS